MKKWTLKDRAKVLADQARANMRYCALKYRSARRAGSLQFMLAWLIHATTYRRLAAGYQGLVGKYLPPKSPMITG
jgi:hypothetical protein